MRNLFWLVSLAALALTGCTQMDQRDDGPTKKPLPELAESAKVTRVWGINAGDGSRKKDLRLVLTRVGDDLYTVDNSGHVYSINEKSGQINWELTLRAPVSAGPAVAEGKLVVGTSDGKVIAVDLQQHKIAWTSSTSSEVLATPQISEGMVFIHTMDGGLSALSLTDGRQLWRFTHSLPPLMLRKSSTPAVTEDLVIAGFANGKLLGIQKHNGSVQWVQELSMPKGSTDLQRMVDISADPVVSGENVYAVSYQGNLAGMNAATGNKLWEREIPSFSGFIILDKHIYVSTTNGEIVSLDVATGQTYWLQEDLLGRRLSKPALDGKYLVVGDDEGLVHWVDRDSGRLIARFKLDKDGIEATPQVHNKIVYVLGRGGKVAALAVD